MSLQSELENLNNAVQRMKREVRRALLRQLGVDKLVRRAFEEGWSMQKDNYEEFPGGEVWKTPCWRSVDEAFANSNVEEEV